MKARMARQSDCSGVVSLARQAHTASRYRDIPFNEEACLDAVRRHVGMGLPPSNGATALFVAGEDQIEAALGAMCYPLYECLGAIVITDVFWYGENGSGLAVLREFHRWAEKCGSPYVLRQGVTDFILTDPDRTGAVLARQGFRRAGHIFEREHLT